LFAQYTALADVPFFLLYLLALIFLGGNLALVLVGFASLMFLGQWMASSPQRHYGRRGQAASVRKATLLTEMAAGLAFFQISHLRHVMADRWDAEVRDSALLRGRQRFWQVGMQSWGALCIGVASIAALFAGVYKIEAGS